MCMHVYNYVYACKALEELRERLSKVCTYTYIHTYACFVSVYTICIFMHTSPPDWCKNACRKDGFCGFESG